METCPVCGAPVSADDRVCPACGAELHEHTASFPPVEGEASVESHDHELEDGPVLVVRKGPELGEKFYIDRAKLTIGRDPVCDIFLNDITVSRAHARLELAGGSVSLVDEGSLNGVYVNGVSVDRAVLRSGDQVQIGRFQMVFLTGGGE